MKKLLFVIMTSLHIICYSNFNPNYNNCNSLRKSFSLNGLWNISMSPFNKRGDKKLSAIPRNNYEDQVFVDRLKVPGDWNTQNNKLYYYEATVNYKKVFKIEISKSKNYLLNFDAVNYRADVFLNGEKIGTHKGGFTPFYFNITDRIKNGKNCLVVRVEGTRLKDAMPTTRYDWWNYCGITRDVSIIETPNHYIKSYKISLKDKNEIQGEIYINSETEKNLNISIPELGINQIIKSHNGNAKFRIKTDKIELWSPNNPRLYQTFISLEGDTVEDQIGFRTIKVIGDDIQLNGKKVFLRGINIHEEAPMGVGRITTKEECTTLLNWAKELGCNFVRLAHYPHTEHMLKEADRLGLMVWAEIPVYWNINFKSENAYKNASQMMSEMIHRDINRASVILWSVANETRESDERQEFLTKLLKLTKSIDNSRLTTAAIEAYKVVKNVRVIDDEIGKYLDVIGINCYCGWYFRTEGDCPEQKWEVKYKKPCIFSEFGAGALQGLHGDKTEKWTEEYQANVFKQNIEMIKKQMPFIDGLTPWLLMDFRSPIRPNKIIQNDYNRKGLISEKGIRKKAFYTLQKFYDKKRIEDN